MNKLMEDMNIKRSVKEGVTMKQLVFRWLMVLLLVCGVCVWVGCGSDDDDDSTTTQGSTDNTSSVKSGVYEQNGGDVTETDKTYAATETDQSAVYVYGAGTYTLSDSTLTKTGDSSAVQQTPGSGGGGECSDFTGLNAIVLAEGASTINLTNVDLSSDSSGSNGVFAYEKNSVVNVTNCTISTTGNSARGADATYGGTINISDSTITTTGAHCSALATDRYDAASGEPKVNASNVTATVGGDGSVGIYSTGDFYVDGCIFTSTGSGAAVIEGTNSIELVDTDMTVTMAGKYGVMVYQSMSGDALGNTGTFIMEGGSITVNGGPILLNTNDEAYFTLEDVVLDGSDLILHTGKIDWGATASNGGISHFTAINQDMVGDFKVDGYGNIEANFSNSSNLEGAIDPDNSTNLNTSGTEGGYVSLTMDASSTWTVTADSYIDELIDADGTYSNITGAYNVYVTGYSGANNVSLVGGGTLYLP